MKENFKPLHTVVPQSITVVDGDTVKFRMGEHTFYVQLIGIDAPALNSGNIHKSPEPFSIEAKERLDQLLFHQAIDWKIGLHKKLTDSTKERLLGTIYVNLDGEYVNASHILLSEGLAVPYKGRPGLTKEERVEYDLLAFEAQRRQLGVYSIPGYVKENGKYNKNNRAV